MSGAIWHLLEHAKASSMMPAQVIELLLANLRRTATSLARRERRHRQTAYDAALERDVEVIARANVLLQASEARRVSP